MAEKSTTQKDKKKAEREARLVKALRDNLRRRKQASAPTEVVTKDGEMGDGEDQGDNKA